MIGYGSRYEGCLVLFRNIIKVIVCNIILEVVKRIVIKGGIDELFIF